MVWPERSADMSVTSSRGPCLTIGTIGVNATDVVATCLQGTADYDWFSVHALTATLDVQATVDGTNWVVVAVQDLTATASATFVTTLTVGKIGLLRGKFLGVRIRQSGATAANGTLLAG
jgi:hypothetical protein